jgi:hypothetical protein
MVSPDSHSSRAAAKSFTDGMRKLLEKKTGKPANKALQPTGRASGSAGG